MDIVKVGLQPMVRVSLGFGFRVRFRVRVGLELGLGLGVKPFVNTPKSIYLIKWTKNI